MVEQESRLEKTIQLYAQKYNYFDINERMTICPLSKMLFTVKAFCNCFNYFDKQKHIKKLEEIYNKPIEFVLKNCKTGFSERKKYTINVKKTLTQLEWIFYRDSHRYTPLKQQYSVDALKPKMSKAITFEDIIAIKGLIEMEISRIFTDIVKVNNVELESLTLPDMSSNNANIEELMQGGKKLEQ